MVTSRLLEAFLTCPVKCHLLSEGERPTGTEYSSWAAAREESYRREAIQKLTSQETAPCIASPEPGLWKSESWQFAVGETLQTQGWEAEIALIQRFDRVAFPMGRIADMLPGQSSYWLYVAAATVWLACFVPWVLRYLPVYMRPRVDGQAG